MSDEKIMEVQPVSLDQVLGKELIEVEHRKDGCAEGSEEVVLHFTGGKEISIYFNGATGTVVVEGD